MQKKKLEEEKKELENKVTEIDAKIIKIEEEKKKVLMEQKEFETTDSVTDSDTGVVGKGGKDKVAAFKIAHNYVADLNAWHKDLLDNKLDNLYEVNWKGTKYNTLEEIGIMRIAYEVCWQIAQATDFDAKVDANTNDYVKNNVSSLKSEFGKIKGWAGLMTDEDSLGEKGGIPTSKVIGTDKDGKNIYLKVHEFEKPNTFKFTDFINFMEKFAPINEINGGSQKHLIDELSGPWGTEKKKWCTWEASSTAMSKEERDKWIKEGNAPQIFKHKDFKIYKEDTSKSKIIELEPGLRGWIELYHAAFFNKGNREKITLVRDGTQMYDTTKTITVKDSNLTRVLDLNDTTFKGKYTYESDVLETDENGNKQLVWCIYDVDDINRLFEARKRALANQSKSLSDNNLINQQKLVSEKESKISEENAKLEKKDKEIQELVKAEIGSKQKKVTDMAITTWSDDKWGDAKNVLKAAGAKKLLLDIKWLENDGSDNGSFKDSKTKANNQATLDVIESKRKASPQLWNAVIKQYFESLGTDLNSRITAGKADTEIGLEIIRDAYEEIGDQTVLDAINAELAKEKDSPTSDLTPADLKDKFGLSAEPEQTVVDKWKTVDGVSLDKDKIGTILDTHITDAAKKGKLIDYLKKLPDSEGIDKTSDDTILTSFFKKDPKKVIETIIAHELEDNTAKTALIKKMKEWKSADKKDKLADSYFGDDGEPTEAGLKLFAYETKLGKDHSTKSIETSDDNIPTNNDEKTGAIAWLNKNYWWPVWVPILLVIGGAVIFWKNISDWWNGPAEEQGEGKVENDEKDEENE